MSRTFSALLVVVAVIASGVVHGYWTNRWGSPPDLEQAVDRMENLPWSLGDWDGHPGELDARQVAVADISGHLVRQYVNRRSGAVVTVLLLCGRPGPLAVHTPEICYRGMGYALVGTRIKHAAGMRGDEFWVTQFRKPRAFVAEHLRIFYAWNAHGTWEASDSPRRHFARAAALYKLYVIRQLPREDEPLQESPDADFLSVLLPELQKCLFPGP